MRDRDRWTQAKARARVLAEEAGATDARQLVRTARAVELELAEAALPSSSVSLPHSKLARSALTAAAADAPQPLQLTIETLRAWQARNVAQASEAELLAAAMLLADSEPCAGCNGARFVRDPAYKPGRGQEPLHGARSAVRYSGVMPCPECTPGASTGWLRSSSNVPMPLHALDFATFDARAGKEAARDSSQKWACDSGNLLLYGEPGRGKTHLAIAAVLAACAAGSRAQYWPWQDALVEMQRRFDIEHDSAQAFEQQLARVPMLALDDLGAEQRSRSGWSTEVFEHLLDARLQHQLPTLITTNLAPGELAARVGMRAASRLQLFEVVEVGGIDMRAVIAQRGAA